MAAALYSLPCSRRNIQQVHGQALGELIVEVLQAKATINGNFTMILPWIKTIALKRNVPLERVTLLILHCNLNYSTHIIFLSNSFIWYIKVYIYTCAHAAPGYDNNCKKIPDLESAYNSAEETCSDWNCCDKACALDKKTTAETDCSTDKQDCK